MNMSATNWKLDPSHSTLEFSVKHMMITTVKGRFAEVDGAITLGENGIASVTATIPAASIDTRTEQRDQHLRSGDFLDVEQHPTITFESTAVSSVPTEPGQTFDVEGNLTIRGVTKPTTLQVTYEGEGKDPWGGTRRSFSARGALDRTAFGLTWNAALETGGVLVSNEIKLNFDLQAVLQG
jgi:polyisoprenoid-binding protein YceI